jgi:hypothetical protein
MLITLLLHVNSKYCSIIPGITHHLLHKIPTYLTNTHIGAACNLFFGWRLVRCFAHLLVDVATCQTFHWSVKWDEIIFSTNDLYIYCLINLLIRIYLPGILACGGAGIGVGEHGTTIEVAREPMPLRWCWWRRLPIGVIGIACMGNDGVWLKAGPAWLEWAAVRVALPARTGIVYPLS